MSESVPFDPGLRPDPGSTKPTSVLQAAIDAHKVPATVVGSLLGATPVLLQIPGPTPTEVWAAVGVLVVMTVAAHLASMVTVLVVASILTTGFAGCEAAVRSGGDHTSTSKPADDQHGGSDSDRGGPPAPRITRTGAAPVKMLQALSKRWVLHKDGAIYRLDDKGRLETTFRVAGPARDMAACAGAILVTHANGKVARISPVSGKTLVDYPYDSRSGAVICEGGSVWVAKESQGTILQLTRDRLAVVDQFVVASRIKSITYGDGAVWTLDPVRHEIVGVRVRNAERLGPYPVATDAVQVLYARGAIWILHRETSCLKRFDLIRRFEVGAGVPLGPNPWRMTTQDGVIHVVDHDDGSIVDIDAETGRAVGAPIVLQRRRRLMDADVYGTRLVALDASRGLVISLSAAAAEAHRRRTKFRATSACPRA